MTRTFRARTGSGRTRAASARRVHRALAGGGLPLRVRATPAANAAVDALRGRARNAYEDLERELKAQGCKAVGYRLLARDGGASELCCKHLTGEWRVVTTFEPDVVWVVAVGEPDGPAFYRQLSEHYDINDVGQKRDHRPNAVGGRDGRMLARPACSGAPGGRPSLVQKDVTVDATAKPW